MGVTGVARQRTPFRNRVRDRRYAEIIRQAAAHPGGTMHKIPVLYPDEATARKHKNLIYLEGRYQGYSRKVHVTTHDDGTASLAFQLWSRLGRLCARVAAASRGKGVTTSDEPGDLG